MFAAEACKRRAHSRSYSCWRWHVDEVLVPINGVQHYLWRAVDLEGQVIEVFASKPRNRKAAPTFLRRAMKRYGSSKIIVTDRLASYGAALKALRIKLPQWCGRWLNNRAENSHKPFRRREGAMAGRVAAMVKPGMDSDNILKQLEGKRPSPIARQRAFL